MANQSYGGSGLFGQPSFGNYSGLSRGVPEPMTTEQIQQQLAYQQDQYRGQPSYQDLYNSPESSGFNANVNTRSAYTGNVPINSFVNPMPFPSVSDAVNMSQQKVTPVEAINQVSVRNDSNANLPPAPKGKMWEFDANSNQYVLVDDPLSNLSQDASQTAPVASAQQVAMLAPTLSAPASTSSSIVQGMFPEVESMQRALYQQKQNEAMQAQAMQYAQLDPMARAQYSLYLGGQQLGGAIGGALGAKDPQLQQISMRNAIMRRLDPSDPAQQMKVAQEIAQYDPEFAMSIADNARKSAVQIAQANKESKASVAPRVQESQRAGVITSAIRQYKALPQTPEVVQAIETLQSELDFLKPKAEATPNDIQIAQSFAEQKGKKGTKEYNAEYVSQLLRLTDQKENIIDVGVADKTREVVYFDKKSNEQFIMKPNATGALVRTPYSGGIDKTTAKVSATASQKGEEAGSKEMYTLYAKRLDDANKASMKALDQAGVLKQMLDTPQTITGSAVGLRTATLRAFNTLGIASPKDSQALDNADSFNSLAGQHVLTFIKTLGVNPTDADVRFAKSIGPDLQKSPEANATLINYLLNRAKDVMTEADNMEKHYTDNKGSLAGYKSVFRRNIESSVKPVEQMTKEELKAAIEAKKREAQ